LSWKEAKETVMELVRSLLLLSGAPAFVEEFADDLQALEKYKTSLNRSTESNVRRIPPIDGTY
jgi:hypothetical protein